MALFPKLLHASTYRPIRLELSAATLPYWLGVFRHQIDSAADQATATGGGTDEARARALAARAEFRAWLDTLERDPAAAQCVDLLTFDARRDAAFARHGFPDPFRAVKRREIELALPLLPGVLAEVDALDGDARLRALVEGIFAGNIFDLGVVATIELFRAGGTDFHHTRAKLRPRPWRVDDYDAFAARWAGPPHHKAAVLVDNAGADVVLGMVPFIRELVRRGTRVLMGVNSLPSLNDITYGELVPLMRRVAAVDAVVAAALRDGRLVVIPTGCRLPLIDLTQLEPRYCAACADIDLLVLEGMGRAVESNFEASFSCDTLKVAMVKDAQVAAYVGGEVYDVVCRFQPA